MSSDYYEQQLHDGQEFQDFAQWQLALRGIVLNNYQSRVMQIQHGENMLGLEIKYDKKFATTGHLWIECAEKTSSENAAWVSSGIHRADNSWLYGIGNYDTFFIFGKRMLQRYQRIKQPRILENDRRTSQGFLLIDSVALLVAERVVQWSAARDQQTQASPMTAPVDDDADGRPVRLLIGARR